MTIVFSLILFTLLFPNFVMSVESILVNHLFMMTAHELKARKIYNYLVRFDMLFTSYVGFKYAMYYRQMASGNLVMDFFSFMDSKMSRALYKVMKPLLARPGDK